jgi:hypothetical protein
LFVLCRTFGADVRTKCEPSRQVPLPPLELPALQHNNSFHMNPVHPVDEPFDIQDLLSAVRHISPATVSSSPCTRQAPRPLEVIPSRAREIAQRMFGHNCTPNRSTCHADSDPEREGGDPATSEQCRTRPGSYASGTQARRIRREWERPVALLTTIQGLSIHEPSYIIELIFYSQCEEAVLRHRAKPSGSGTFSSTPSSIVAYQPADCRYGGFAI